MSIDIKRHHIATRSRNSTHVRFYVKSRFLVSLGIGFDHTGSMKFGFWHEHMPNKILAMVCNQSSAEAPYGKKTVGHWG